MLGITDLNIEFDDTQPEQFHEEVIKGQTVTVWHFKLTYHRRCDQCGFTLNNNGHKTGSARWPSQWLPLQLPGAPASFMEWFLEPFPVK